MSIFPLMIIEMAEDRHIVLSQDAALGAELEQPVWPLGDGRTAP